LGLVLQVDQPNRDEAAYLWLAHPNDGQAVPEFAFEYPAEAGRHSHTYAALGLERGNPALKLIIRSLAELNGTITYVKAMSAHTTLPHIAADKTSSSVNLPIIDADEMPSALEPKKRREAIPRMVQREVWQRDGGRCVECATKERLCFDHIVPYSKGGSNTVRNIQLLCEPCNLSKGNRL
jgi:hypothetical protein